MLRHRPPVSFFGPGSHDGTAGRRRQCGAGGGSGARRLARAGRSLLHHGAGRHGRRRGQGGTAGGRRRHARLGAALPRRPGGRPERLLPGREPQQAQRGDRPAQRAGTAAVPGPGGAQRCGGGELRARRGRTAGAGSCGTMCGPAGPGALLDHRIRAQAGAGLRSGDPGAERADVADRRAGRRADEGGRGADRRDRRPARRQLNPGRGDQPATNRPGTAPGDQPDGLHRGRRW